MLQPMHPYDVHVELDLPLSPHNQRLGNVMLALHLLHVPPLNASHVTRHNRMVAHVQKRNQTLHEVRRSVLLPFQSPLLSWIRTWLRMPCLILECMRESQTIRLPLLTRLLDIDVLSDLNIDINIYFRVCR